MTLRLPIAAPSVLSVDGARTGGMEELSAHPGHPVKQCMACHATFKAR